MFSAEHVSHLGLTSRSECHHRFVTLPPSSCRRHGGPQIAHPSSGFGRRGQLRPRRDPGPGRGPAKETRPAAQALGSEDGRRAGVRGIWRRRSVRTRVDQGKQKGSSFHPRIWRLDSWNLTPSFPLCVLQKGKQIFYLVRWKGYGSEDETWEPESGLGDASEVLEAFLAGAGQDVAEEPCARLYPLGASRLTPSFCTALLHRSKKRGGRPRKSVTAAESSADEETPAVRAKKQRNSNGAASTANGKAAARQSTGSTKGKEIRNSQVAAVRFRLPRWRRLQL